MVRHALILISLILVSACTVIEVHGAHPSTSYRLGVLKVAPDQKGTIAYRLRGFGLVPGLHGMTLGYRVEDVVMVADPQECRLIVFDAPREKTERQTDLHPDQFCRRGE